MSKDHLISGIVAIIVSGVPVPNEVNVNNPSYWVQIALAVLTGLFLKVWVKKDKKEDVNIGFIIMEASASVMVCFVAWIAYYHFNLTYNIVIYMIGTSFAAPHIIRAANNIAKYDLKEILAAKFGLVKKDANDTSE